MQLGTFSTPTNLCSKIRIFGLLERLAQYVLLDSHPRAFGIALATWMAR